MKKAALKLEAEPGVVYAEPNYVYHTTAVPNDPSFAQQWALDNQGQTVNQVGGTAGADTEAARAWDITTGSRAVKVAVVDTGVSYASPDLRNNVYTDRTTGEHGRDFILGREPLDWNGHGSHVAGIIGSEGNNGIGIAGLNWRVSLLSLRALGTEGGGSADNIADAFVYAGRQGVKVVNASFGGGSPSRAMAEAISMSPGTLFVAAAGNFSSDVEQFSTYPCIHTQPNLLCVAATDQNDQLDRLSNWGDASVDLAAPGTNILGWDPPRKMLFKDDFETELGNRWQTSAEGEPWSRGTRFHRSPTHALSDSPDGPYQSSRDAIAEIAQPFDFTDLRECEIQFHLHFDPAWLDSLAVQVLSPGWSYWTNSLWDSSFSERHDGLARVYAPDVVGSGYRLRFRFQRSDSDGLHEGADIDDVEVSCDDPLASDYGLEYFSGTSAAAPHVVGAAALVWASHPDASVAEVKNALLDSVDPLPSLAGKTVTGGRLNAYKAVTAPLREPPLIRPGKITTVTGDTYTDGDGLSWKDAYLDFPSDVEALADGGYLIADTRNNRVRRRSPAAGITTVAGNGGSGTTGDGGPATAAEIGPPGSIAATPDGGVLIASNERVRKVWPNGQITTVACGGGPGFSGDGGPAANAGCIWPWDVDTAADGGFIFADGNRRVRRVSPAGTISTVYEAPADGGVQSVAATSDGGFLYSDRGQIRRVSPSGDVVSVAGDGKDGFKGDLGPALGARLSVADMEATPDGGVLVADSSNHRIRRVTPKGAIFTVAGSALFGWVGDGGPATDAQLFWPHGVASTRSGGILIADSENNRIRFVDSYQAELPDAPPPREPSPPTPPPEAGNPPVPPSGGGPATVGKSIPQSMNGPVPGPALQPDTVRRSPKPSMVIRRTQVARRVLKRGVRFKLTCHSACKYWARLTLDRKGSERRRLGKEIEAGQAVGELPSGGQRNIRVRLSPLGVQAVRRSRQRLTLQVIVTAAGGEKILERRSELRITH